MSAARPTIAFFGSSLVSAYWNGAATYYRGIIRALHARGYAVTFYEPDAFERQAHRDIPDPTWARVVVYPATESGAAQAIRTARTADIVVKASGVGVLDDWLEAAVLAERREGTLVLFWDVDAAATLDRLAADPADAFHALVPQFDLVLTYGGGPPVVAAYEAVGARRCVPIYNAVDPDVHRPAPADPRFRGDLGFLGNRLPDRESRVDEFFFRAASLRPEATFVLGGSGWHTRALPGNVRYAGHVYTRDHNAFNCSASAVLNINRDSMARMGYSPATRVFEAAGAGACIVTDPWQGLDTFFEPGHELLVAGSGADVASILDTLTPEHAAAIGGAARARAFRDHTYADRVQQLMQLLSVERAA
jgi:spore maturation protein CgeB